MKATLVRPVSRATGILVLALLPRLALALAQSGDPSPWLPAIRDFAMIVVLPALALVVGWSAPATWRRAVSGIACTVTLIWWMGFFQAHPINWIEPESGRSILFRLRTINAGFGLGMLAGIVLLAVLILRASTEDYGFDAIAPGDFGDATWMSMTRAGQLFASGGEIVVGELYRPDQDPANGGGAFDPRNKVTWGKGGTAPLATFSLNFDSTHMLFFAGSGGFKTTSTVVPTALRYAGSMVVLDPSCEVAPLVERHRRQMAGGRMVALLDPTAHRVTGFNVLGPLIKSPNQEADAVAFARLLSSENPGREQGSNAFFSQQAHNLLTGLLLLVLTDEEWADACNLRGLRNLTSLSEKALQDKIKKKLLLPETRPFIKETLAPFVDMAAQTWTGIASSVAKDTQWLSLDKYAAMVCGSAFRAQALADGELDVFVQIPGDILKSYPGIARTIIGSLMRAMVQAEGRHKRRVLFCLDEVDLLGYMNVLEEARDRGRKYGITLMLMYQSVGQLEQHFGKEGATSWFEGVSFVSYAAIKSMETAKQLSERCGETTIRVENQSHGTSLIFGPLSSQAAGRQTRSFSLQKRPLILAHEIVQDMRADEQIIAVRGQPPLRLGRAIYFRRPDMMAQIGTAKFR